VSCPWGAPNPHGQLGPRLRPPPGVMPAAGSRGWQALRRLSQGLRVISGVDGAQPEMPVVVPGTRMLTTPLRVMIVLDVSGSTGGTDPERQSHRAAIAVCDWLSGSSANSDDRIGLIRFADRAETIPATLVADARAVFEEAFAKGASVGGGTSIAPAINEACSQFDSCRDRRVAIVVTDGQVSENDATLAQLFGRLNASADGVYLLALDHDRAWTRQTYRRYRDIPLKATTAIGSLTRAHLAHSIASILVSEAGLTLENHPGRGTR
jgi:von Willebrand factor type A domain